MMPLRLSLFACIIAALVSCAGPSKSFYVLTAEGPAPSGGGRGIGVGPVSLAEYLDRPNLVFQQSSHQMAIAESHRWAGNLEQNIARVVATNLGRDLSTGNIRTYPWQTDEGLRYQVTLDIRSLHGTAEGDAFIDAAWRIYSLPERRMIAQRSWSGNEPLENDGYEALVAAQSRLLGRLSREIATSMR